MLIIFQFNLAIAINWFYSTVFIQNRSRWSGFSDDREEVDKQIVFEDSTVKTTPRGSNTLSL